MTGGVLSTRNGSLSSESVRPLPGGLEGESVAEMRRTYSPSGKALESQLNWRMARSFFRIFQVVSLLPRISTV